MDRNRKIHDRIMSVIFTYRQELIRIISARQHETKMKKEHIVTRRWGDRAKGKTDWARVDAMTDEEVEGRSQTIPIGPIKDIDWSNAVLVIPPRKRRSPFASMKTCSTISRARATAISAASTRCCVPTCSRRPSRKSAPEDLVIPGHAQRDQMCNCTSGNSRFRVCAKWRIPE